MNESVIRINGANMHKPLSAHELHLPGGFQEGHGPPADPFQSILRTGLGNPEGLRQHFLGWGRGVISGSIPVFLVFAPSLMQMRLVCSQGALRASPSGPTIRVAPRPNG